LIISVASEEFGWNLHKINKCNRKEYYKDKDNTKGS